MRTVIVNQVMAFMLACAPVCGWHAAASVACLETARDLLCSCPDEVANWQLNPALPERLILPKERLPLEHRARLGSAVAAAPAVLAKIDILHVHQGGLPATASGVALPHSLFSVFCLLIV